MAVTYRSGEPPEGLFGVRCDVTDAASVDQAFTEVEAAQGPVEVLVANAGITRDQLLALMSEDDFTSVIDTNLTGSWRVAKRASKGMLRLKRGRVVFISSVVGLSGSAGQTNYAASKAGLVGLASSLARELGSRSITANVVAPGFVETDMTAALTDDLRATYKSQIPLGRFASSGEVARVVRFLASEDAGYITGAGDPRGRRPRHGSLGGSPSDGRRHVYERLLNQDVHRRGANMGLLDGKRILVTGVLMDSSIAFHVAKLAQEEGAEVVLTSFGRAMKITQAVAKRLPSTPQVIELDASNAEDFDCLAGRVREHVDRLDGVLHSIGYAPEAALGGNFLQTEWADVATAVQISAYSLKALAVGAKPLMPSGGSVVGLTLRRHGRLAQVRLDGRREGRLRVDRALPRPRPRPDKIRVNLVAAGPLKTTAAKSIPGFEEFDGVWSSRAPC